MPNLRDTVIVFLEDIIENGTDAKVHSGMIKHAEELLEVLEDMRDGYGNHTWDDDE